MQHEGVGLGAFAQLQGQAATRQAFVAILTACKVTSKPT